MTLMKRNQDVSNLNQLFDSFFRDEPLGWLSGMAGKMGNNPSVNIEETADEYLLSLAVPGMKKDQFRIEVNQNVLTISGEVKDESSDEDKHYARREFHMESFTRSFNLPEGKIDDQKIKANYDDGVLKVKLPKRAEAKPAPSRLIEVK